ncbi:1-acyl-sn-glycerol-3-phosphate acyltransferase [Notoacmeibacter sp. MSK16QG-6]|uniref:lysophospholipid acyltransferase family protein n=1 Tax=Notoacmeibacter sp. MSK16QG-6 TaxID=2957982 RepID=UPI00209D5E64|nr:lysophospholipid acyltransferase family protein [Notoacmeibacter sp. MSK16QG-6]
MTSPENEDRDAEGEVDRSYGTIPPERVRVRRSIFRAAFLAPLLIFSLLPMGLIHLVLTRSPVPSHRYAMTRLWYRFALRVVGLRVIREGRPAKARPLLLLANHVSWTDILVLGAYVPGCFVAKADMEDWPGIGFLTRFTRSIFVKRDDPRKAGEQAREIGDRLRGGEPVILFPEGTTAAGTEIKPFKSSLLGAVRLALPRNDAAMTIQPAALAYVRRGGEPMDADDRRNYAAWIDDEEFAPHLTSVMFGPPMTVRLIFGEPFEAGPGADRKALTRKAETDIAALLANGLADG